MNGSGPDPDDGASERVKVAAELRRFKHFNADSAELVAQLADDLEQEDHAQLELWAELDLVSVFAHDRNLTQSAAAIGGKPPSLISAIRSSLRRDPAVKPAAQAKNVIRLLWTRIAAVREQGWERAAEGVLGVLVFVPLLVTWTGLALAASAYGDLAASGSAQSTRPFLQLWESGFDGRLPTWARFGDIAVTAVLFIGMLLLLSAFHSLARHRAQSEADRQEMERERQLGRLVPLFARAQLVVGGYRIGSPTRLAQALSGRSGDMSKLLRGAKAAQDAAGKVIGQVGDLLASLQAVTDGVRDAAKNISDVQEQGIAALGTAMDSSTQRLLDAHQTAAAAGQQATESAMASVQRALDSVQSLQEQALAASERGTREGHEVVREGVKALLATQDAALDSLRQAQEASTRAATQGADAVGSVGASLRSTGERIDAALRELASSQAELGRRSGESVTATERSAASMQAMTQSMARAISELRNSVERWDAAAAHWENAAAAVERGTRRPS